MKKLSITGENLTYMVVLFIISNFDVNTQKKTEDLEYRCLKSKFLITNLRQNGSYYAEKNIFYQISKNRSQICAINFILFLHVMCSFLQK